MNRTMMNTLSNDLKNTITDKLYRFSDSFFDDSREKTDFMDMKCVQYIIDHSGVIYLALKKESSRLMPVLSELYEIFTGLPDFLKHAFGKWLPGVWSGTAQIVEGFMNTNIEIETGGSDMELHSRTCSIANRLMITFFTARIRLSRMTQVFDSGINDQELPLNTGYYVRYLEPQNLPIRSSPG